MTATTVSPEEIPDRLRRKINATTVRALRIAEEVEGIGREFERLTTAVEVLANDETTDGTVWEAWDQATGLADLFKIIATYRAWLCREGDPPAPLHMAGLKDWLAALEGEQGEPE